MKTSKIIKFTILLLSSFIVRTLYTSAPGGPDPKKTIDYIKQAIGLINSVGEQQAQLIFTRLDPKIQRQFNEGANLFLTTLKGIQVKETSKTLNPELPKTNVEKKEAKQYEEYDKIYGIEKLDTHTRIAGLGSGGASFYSHVKNPVSDENWKRLHKEGNSTEDNALLTNIFFNSMFQFYSDWFLGPLSPYVTFGKAYEKNKLAVDSAMKSFQENNYLIKLAIAYQRRKIFVEKLGLLLVKGELSEQAAQKLQQIYLNEDQLVENIQTLIFNWIKQGYDFVKAKLRGASYHQSEEIGKFLKDFVPYFINSDDPHPLYKKIIDNLDSYTKPIADEIDINGQKYQLRYAVT